MMFMRILRTAQLRLNTAILEASGLRTGLIPMTARWISVGKVSIKRKLESGSRAWRRCPPRGGGVFGGTFLTLLVAPVLFRALERRSFGRNELRRTVGNLTVAHPRGYNLRDRQRHRM